jgi:flagellar basal body-associated protein FliL
MAETAESEPTADTPAPKPAGKKRLLLIAAGAVVLLAAGGGGAYFAGLLDGGADIATTAEHAAEHAAEPVATAPSSTSFRISWSR